MPAKDDIGIRGESLFVAHIMQFCGRNRPFFTPHFLGDKFPTIDYIVELNDTDRPMHFFAQVKSTRRGYTDDAARRLKIGVAKSDANRLISYPAPAYVIGIDEPGERAFIASVDKHKTISSITTAYPLTCSILQTLWDEVENYWKSRNMLLGKSAFAD